MKHEQRFDREDLTCDRQDWSRRELLRRAGMIGVGALGAGLVGCKNAPQQDIVDVSTNPQVLQAGGTVTGTLTGLLTGAAAAGVTVRVTGFGEVSTDDAGSFELRIPENGDYPVEFRSPAHHPRVGTLRVAGNVTLAETLLETGAGLPMAFLNQYARAEGPNDKEGITPRNPGATNRWTRPPQVRIYRRLADNPKKVVPAARVAALQSAVATLFGPLTANRLGFASVQVRPGEPPASLEQVPAGVLAIAQREDGLLGTQHGASLTDRYDINRALTFCGVDSSIDLFHRVFAHALGVYVVSNAFDSIANPQGRMAPSDRDLLAATFLYARAPGNMAPDRDATGVLLNG